MERKVELTDGVIVGTSRRQEWLLPWWWMHFRLHNNQSVTFIDFGDLSQEAVHWCKERGQLIKLDLSDDFITKKQNIDPALVKQWEKMQPDVWDLRFTWYKKPFACLLSPYQRTLWLDLDCQVRGSITPLFNLCENEGGFAAAAEHIPSQNLNIQRGTIAPGQKMYNAGVLVFKNHSKILSLWVDRCRDQNHLHCSDQQVLAHVLNLREIAFMELSPYFNWTADLSCQPEVVILHWWGDAGKKNLKKCIEDMSSQWNMNLSFDDLSRQKVPLFLPVNPID